MVERMRALMRRTDWLGRAAVTLAVTVVTVGVTGVEPAQGGRAPGLLGAGLLLVASLCVGAARRFPRAAFGVSLLAVGLYQGLGFTIQSPYFLPLLFTGYSAGMAGRRVHAAGLALAGFAVFGLAGLGAGDIRGGLFLPVLILIAAVSGEVVGEVRAADRLRREADRRRQEELLLAEERMRIARELHDVVSHSIAMIGVQAGVAAHVLDRDPEQARTALAAIKTASREALQDLRGILGLLRLADEADPRAPAAGLARMPELLDGVRRAGVTVSVNGADLEQLPPATDVAAFRIVQEALTNIVRHAPGARAQVRLERSGQDLEIEVVNDSAPAHGERARGSGQGLTGMRERATAAGGSVAAGPEPGGGFAVRARLPLREDR